VLFYSLFTEIGVLCYPPWSFHRFFSPAIIFKFAAAKIYFSAVKMTITRRRIPVQFIFEEYSKEQGKTYRQAMDN
jgi:hypothetical protein